MTNKGKFQKINGFFKFWKRNANSHLKIFKNNSHKVNKIFGFAIIWKRNTNFDKMTNKKKFEIKLRKIYGQFLIKIGFNLTVLFLNFGLLIYLFKLYVLHCIVFFNQ